MVVIDHTEGHTDPTSRSDPLLQTITQMLQAQTAAMEAQSRAVAMQHLPRLPVYTGEERQITG